MGYAKAGGSYLVDRACAEKAVQMSLPMIEEAMKDKDVCGSGFLHIVVMDPARHQHSSTFEGAILYEHAIGERDKWDADYAKFARAKARLAWRNGMDADKVQELRPHLLIAEDIVAAGGIVQDGIVVGVSGAHPWFDEAFAGTVAMCVRALAKAGMRRDHGLFLR